MNNHESNESNKDILLTNDELKELKHLFELVVGTSGEPVIMKGAYPPHGQTESPVQYKKVLKPEIVKEFLFPFEVSAVLYTAVTRHTDFRMNDTPSDMDKSEVTIKCILVDDESGIVEEHSYVIEEQSDIYGGLHYIEFIDPHNSGEISGDANDQDFRDVILIDTVNNEEFMNLFADNIEFENRLILPEEAAGLKLLAESLLRG